MYSYNDILYKLKIDNNQINRNFIKSIINALLINGDAIIDKQKIIVDINKIEVLWNLLMELKIFFDYRYNTKKDLSSFFKGIIMQETINLNAIFCPGYTNNGYKNYIGNNNSIRIEKLSELKKKLEELKILCNFKITLANIFLENTNLLLNPKWFEELKIHEEKFAELAKEFFDSSEIYFLSNIFSEEKYIEGFVDETIEKTRTYYNFLKNNLEFYKKMGWNDEEIKFRNDKLFTIYTLISNYISEQSNGIYLPMETMYSRSKIMTSNNVCTMYLHK